MEVERDGASRGAHEGLHHLEHGVAAPGAEVRGDGPLCLLQVVEGGEVAAREVHDVDVVAHAGTVGRRIVAPPHAKARQLADRDLRDVGHEVVRDAARVFADSPRGVRADGVEVAKRGVLRFALRENALDLRLVLAVRVGRAKRMVLGERQARGVTVHRGRGAEDDTPRAVRAHRFEEVRAAADVVVMVELRLLDRLAHRLEPREVDDRVHRLRESGVERAALAQVGAMELDRAAGELAQALEDDRLRVRQVVEHDQLVAGLGQQHAGVRADVTEATGDQDSHGRQLPSFW